MDDDAKRRILARRAQFVAAAVVGLVACEASAPSQPPVVCLSISVPPPEDGGPQPTIVDAGVAAEPDASAATAPDADAPPQPCLSPPAPCLSVLPPQPLDAGPPPRVCLSKMPSPPPPTVPPPPPRACLDVRGPD